MGRRRDTDDQTADGTFRATGERRARNGPATPRAKHGGGHGVPLYVPSADGAARHPIRSGRLAIPPRHLSPTSANSDDNGDTVGEGQNADQSAFGGIDPEWEGYRNLES